MDFKIIGLAHGPLFGFQYIDKEHVGRSVERRETEKEF